MEVLPLPAGPCTTSTLRALAADDRVLLLLDAVDDLPHLLGGVAGERVAEDIVVDREAGVEHVEHPAVLDLVLPLEEQVAGDLALGAVVFGGADLVVVEHARDRRAPVVDQQARASSSDEAVQADVDRQRFVECRASRKSMRPK